MGMGSGGCENPKVPFKDRIAQIPSHAQQSVFCGPTGFLLFVLAVVSYTEHRIAAAVYKSRGKKNNETTTRSKNEQQYDAHIKASEKAGLAVYRNTVPFCEMLFVPPAVFLIVHFAIKYNWGIVPTFANEKMMIAYCIAVCFALMFLICLSLRILDLRDNCCTDPINVPVHANGRQFVVFCDQKLCHRTVQTETEEAIKWSEASGGRSMLINFLTLPLRAVTVPVFLLLSVVSFVRFPLDLLCSMMQANCSDNFHWRECGAERSWRLGKEYFGAAFYNLLSVATLGLAEPVLRSRLQNVKVENMESGQASALLGSNLKASCCSQKS